MPKNFFEDMVKVKRANQLQKAKEEIREEVREEEQIIKRVNQKKVEYPPSIISKEEHSPKYALWGVAGVSIIILLFALSYVFTKASIVVNPKIKDVVLNENLSASLDSNTSGLSFHLVEISGEEEKTVEATGEKNVSERATGMVGIYNSFSTSPQALDINTRLEGSNGKIYKTQNKIVIPGKSKSGTPGSVDVRIYADLAGVEYNSVPMDFTIIGFKGTPKYSKFYAGSKGAITGGFKGKVSVITDEEKAKVLNDLKTSLQAKLLKKVTDQTPSGFVLFKDAVFLNTDDANAIDLDSAQDGVLPITMKGTLHGLLFDESNLTKKIAENLVDKYDGSPVYIQNIRNLAFSLSNKDAPSFVDVKNINFNISGATKIVWKVDADKLSAELLGKSKKDFNQILSKYPSIDSANLTISPIWKMSIPDKIKNIKVEVNYPTETNVTR